MAETSIDGTDGTLTAEVLRRAQSVVSSQFRRKNTLSEVTNSIPAMPTDDVQALSRCLVYCRLRPSNKRDGGATLVTMPEPRRVSVKDERHYDFDGTFAADCTQQDVFEKAAVPCIQHAFEGFCSALMCYGQTGTGKSYTMCNTDPANEGIIPRASRYIFDTIASHSKRTYTVIGQYVQIYRDHLGDLMSSDGKERVDIHYDARDGVTFSGCSSHTLTDADSFMQFYTEGNSRRVVTATAMNPESSRGHTAMIVWIFSEDPSDPMGGRMKGKITFIDLAGYERFSKTGITDLNPIMKDEAKTINASLLSLGRVVSSLSSGSKHIPWRNAKLTRILQDSIGGRSRTSIMLTIGPSAEHLYETTNTLQFGLRAMNVKVRAKVSVTMDYEKLAQKLMGMLDERDARIDVLEVQIASRDAERQQLLGQYEADRDILEERFARDLEHLTTTGASEEHFMNLREIYAVELQNLRDQQNEDLSYQDEVNSKEIAKLINEQRHEEAKNLTAMKLAQDSMVESFQRKLELARGGTNDDLLDALRQLSDKDAVLASRANDTARLHSHIAALTQQLRDLGEEPVEINEYPESFLDVAQVEEIQRRLHEDVGRFRDKVVDLQTQLDRMTLLCNSRNEEVTKLLAMNEQLRDRLQRISGGSADETDSAAAEVVQRLRANREERVDESALETQRLRMQSEIDDVVRQRDILANELQRLKDTATLPRRFTSRPMSSFTCGRDSLTATLRGGNLDDVVTEEDNPQVKRLKQQLASSGCERARMLDTIENLRSLLTSHSIPLPSVEEGPHTEADRASTTQHADISLLLALTAEDASAQEDLLRRQEHRLTESRAISEQRRQVIDALTAQLESLGVTPQVPDTDQQPTETVFSLDEYGDLLRQLRHNNRQMSVQLLSRKGLVPPSLETLLEERDNELELKDEMLLEKSSMAQHMAKVNKRLINQMETLGLTPCCHLPESLQGLAHAEGEHLGLESETQADLERRLEHEAEEKKRMNRLLSALNAEREHQSLVLRQAEAKNRVLEAREDQATRTIFKLAEERSEKEQQLEAAAHRAHLELAEMQKRIEEQKAKRKWSVFGHIFGKWSD